jgi:hypothetical protein
MVASAARGFTAKPYNLGKPGNAANNARGAHYLF